MIDENRPVKKIEISLDPFFVNIEFDDSNQQITKKNLLPTATKKIDPSKSNPKVLFGIMNPRRLPHFVKSLEAFDYFDVVLAQNMEIIHAQKVIQQFAIEKKYDYLLFTSDDVQIPYMAPALLLCDALFYGLDCVSGWSPIRPGDLESNISLQPPPKIRSKRDNPVMKPEYHFLHVAEIYRRLSVGPWIIPVWFLGWSLTLMTLAVVKKWQPRGWYFQVDPRFSPLKNENDEGGFWASSDLWFSFQMWMKRVKKFADLRVCVPHIPPPSKKGLLVGVEDPGLKFIPAKKPLPIRSIV